MFTADEIRRAEDFTSLARLWSWCSLATSLLLACLLGFTRWGASLVERIRGPWWWRVVVTVTALALAGRLATLPFAVLLRRRVLDYGLSHQAWGAYAVDLAKGLAVDVVVTSIALLVLVGAARRWSRAWPAVAGLLLAGLVMLGSFAYPLLVEPLFNTFTPLPDGELRTQIFELADREDVPIDDVLVADASRRTTTLNAYVSGLGSSRRVVVYDNLVSAVGVDDREALSVIAHELGHARHDDVLTGSLLGAAGALLGVGLLGLLGGGVADPRRVPRVLALIAVATLLVQSGAERHQPADRDPGGRGRAPCHRRPRGLHRGADGAGARVAGRPDPAGLVAVLVREPPDGADADRAGPTRGGLSEEGSKCTSPLGSRAPEGRGVKCSAVLCGACCAVLSCRCRATGSR